MKNWREELKSLAEYLGCNEGELISEGMKLVHEVEQQARQEVIKDFRQHFQGAHGGGNWRRLREQFIEKWDQI